MKKRWVILIALLVLSSIILVYAQSLDSEKLVLNSGDKVNSISALINAENLSIGDVFYLEDGRKARVTGVEDIVSDYNFDNLNFFANGVLVHNKNGLLKIPDKVKIVRPDGSVISGKAVSKITIANFKQIAEGNHPHCQWWVKAVSWEEGGEIYVIFWEKQTPIHHRDALASLLEYLGHNEWAASIRAGGQTGPIPLEVLERAQGFQFQIGSSGNLMTRELASSITTQIAEGKVAAWNAQKLSKHIKAVSESMSIPLEAHNFGIDVGALNPLVDDGILNIDELKTLVDTRIRYDFGQ